MQTPNDPSASPMPDFLECRSGSYQALLAPNGRDTFFVTDIQRPLLDPSEELGRFLPKASFSSTGRGGGRVQYTISEELRANARPLRHLQNPQPESRMLPRAEIEAFAEAVKKFLAKAQNSGGALSSFQESCRRELRLPHPDLEPDAYWVCGTDFDRRLVVLWGCERYARSAIPLDQVVTVLRTREMSWEDKQELALKLAQRQGEELARFLAAPAAGGGGVVVNGVVIPQKQLRKLVTISTAEGDAFAQAAERFLAKATEEGTPIFERELRREMRLPNFAQSPEAFFLYGGKMLIALAKWNKAVTVSPVRQTASPLFPGTPDGEPVLVEQLRMNVKNSTPKWIYLAGGAAAVAVLGGLLCVFGPDRVKPLIIKTESIADNRVVVTFNEKVVVKAAGDDTWGIKFTNNSNKVRKVEYQAGNKSQLCIIAENRFEDGSKHELAIPSSIEDNSGNLLDPTMAGFQYLDIQQPKIAPSNWHGVGRNDNELVLVFTKAINPDKLNRRSFTITESEANGKELKVEEARLDPDDKDGRRVILRTRDQDTFKADGLYKLSINGLKDRSANGNEVNVSNVGFAYDDQLPPRIKAIEASGSELFVKVVYSKPVLKDKAENVANYSIQSKAQGIPLKFAGGVTLDPAGKVATLRLVPGRIVKGDYHITISNIEDTKKIRATEDLVLDFQFGDANRSGNPKVDGKVKVGSSKNSLELAFDRGLLEESIKNADNYTIFDSSNRTIRVLSATKGDATNKAVLGLDSTLAAGPYILRYKGLEDMFGEKQLSQEQVNFTVVGSGMAPRSYLKYREGTAPTVVETTKVRLRFHTSLTEASAKNLENYILVPSVTIKAIEHTVESPQGSEESVVILSLAKAPAAGTTIEVQNLELALQKKGPQGLGPQVLR